MSDDVTTFTNKSAEKISYQPGDRVGNAYVLLTFLARGGMGVVYRAWHEQLDREFALKLLAPTAMTDINWKRFELEARTLAKLQHPNVVQIFNMGIDRKGCPFYVMELLDGEPISDVLSEQRLLEINQFLRCFADVCQALKFAHDKKIVHRDIKPSNLMLINSDQPIKSTKVVDFGIARLIGSEELSSQSLTRPGEIFGSPLYMSPEQTLGLPITTATDIYSLGCSMFEIFTGRPPFKGASAFDTMLMQQNEAMPQVKREGCPAKLVDAVEDILARCMEKKPQDRFADVGEILPLLENLSTFGNPGNISQLVAAAAKTARSNNFSENTDSQIVSRQFFTGKLLIASLSCLALVAVIGAFVLFGPWQRKVYLPDASDASSQSNSAVTPFDGHMPNPEADSDLTEWLNSPALISTPLSVNKERWREFYFPTKNSVGEIEVDGKEKENAIGMIQKPVDQPVHFIASEKLKNNPEIYKRFDDHAVYYLTIQYSNKLPDIEVLKTWKNLRRLSFNTCEINSSYFRNLAVLGGLKELFLIDTQCPGEILARTDMLSRLTKLELDRINETSTILQGIKPSNTLSVLTLKGATLGPQEVKIIARLSHVVELNIRESECTVPILQTVANLKQLISLDIRGSKFTAGDLNNLGKMTHLQQLRCDRTQLSAALKKQILKINPTLRFI